MNLFEIIYEKDDINDADDDDDYSIYAILCVREYVPFSILLRIHFGSLIVCIWSVSIVLSAQFSLLLCVCVCVHVGFAFSHLLSRSFIHSFILFHSFTICFRFCISVCLCTQTYPHPHTPRQLYPREINVLIFILHRSAVYDVHMNCYFKLKVFHSFWF